jgi:hypothetical protein
VGRVRSGEGLLGVFVVVVVGCACCVVDEVRRWSGRKTIVDGWVVRMKPALSLSLSLFLFLFLSFSFYIPSLTQRPSIGNQSSYLLLSL